MKTKERVGLSPLSHQHANGNHAETVPVRALAFAWEDWFRHATSAQQAEALALAQRQGYIFAHQLPPPGNGTKPHPAPDGLELLRNLLAGKPGDMRPIPPRVPGPTSKDPVLTLAQRQAALRLSEVPDIGLLRARPGAAAAVIAAIVNQASRAGERVLVLTQQPQALDQILQKLQGCDSVLPVRFLDQGESAAQLPPAIRAYTLDAQRRLFQSGTLAKAQTVRVEAEERCRRRQTEEPIWTELAGLAQTHAALEVRRHTILARIAAIPTEVEADAAAASSSDSFGAAVANLIAARQARRNELDQYERIAQERKDRFTATLADLNAANAGLTSRVDAKKSGRWWTGIWWRATFTNNLLGRMAELERSRSECMTQLTSAESELQELARHREECELRFTTDRNSQISAEIECRRTLLEADIAAVVQERLPATEQWNRLLEKLLPEHRPAAPMPDVVAAAQRQWEDAKLQDEAACLFARQWASFLNESAPQFLAQLPRYASLLAGTASALLRNPDFAAFAEGPFDLVVIDDADRLLENDLLRLARKGRRWLLVGQGANGNGRLSCFDKLWQALHANPSRLPYRWSKEGDRWCCQLKPVAASERRYLESERLADFPEIELRILALPKARPHLAQVLFPASMTLPQAKKFIYRELQEAAVQPLDRGAWLEEGDAAWSLRLGPSASSELMAVELDPGVREWVLATGPTQRIDFDRSAWQRAAVDEWTRSFLDLRDLGRTFDLV